jgi:hypothetical protein
LVPVFQRFGVPWDPQFYKDSGFIDFSLDCILQGPEWHFSPKQFPQPKGYLFVLSTQSGSKQVLGAITAPGFCADTRFPNAVEVLVSHTEYFEGVTRICCGSGLVHRVQIILDMFIAFCVFLNHMFPDGGAFWVSFAVLLSGV